MESRLVIIRANCKDRLLCTSLYNKFMSTFSTTVPREQQEMSAVAVPRGASVGLFLPAFSLWWREIVRFYRMRARVIGVIASPVMFWLVMGSGFGSSLRTGGQNYLEYFFPGALIMIVLFTSIFAMMSVIEDRREGFLLSVLVAPVSRASIVLGKVLGGTTLAAVQGLMFLVLGPLVGIRPGVLHILMAAFAVFLMAFALTALGFTVAWRMDSAQGFHAVVNMFLIPLWLLSGAVFPMSGASGWLKVLMLLNPLTYGMDALRLALFPSSGVGGGAGLGFWAALAVLAGFAAVMFGAAFAMANRRRTLPA
jgi:ABC-2 type transport system permease protein